MSGAEHIQEASVLKLSLHGADVGHLVGLRNGRNSLIFERTFREDIQRPTFSLITHPNFPKAQKLLSIAWVKQQRLHPVLSNLLPEGALRELIARGLKVHPDNEFPLFAHLGADLPGALIAEPVDPDNIPDGLLNEIGNAKPVRIVTPDNVRKFSLAGVQMKFSMKEKDGRYTLRSEGELGDWIIKTPSTTHKDVPLNEYTSMTLAGKAGVQVPEIKLVSLDKLDNLPDVKLPDESHAFAIRRFDRDAGQRVHMEDFAQILVKYPHEKYGAANYEQIGKVVYEYSGDGLGDIQELARRLLVNILLANGDAHLKNWSLLYPDKVTPVLSPAYDIVTTSVYVENESGSALNLGGGKSWRSVRYENFERWSEKVGVPWRAIKPHLKEVMERARDTWGGALKELPMNAGHKKALKVHWASLAEDFRIDT